MFSAALAGGAVGGSTQQQAQLQLQQDFFGHTVTNPKQLWESYKTDSKMAVIVTDARGSIQLANQTMLEMFEVPTAEVGMGGGKSKNVGSCSKFKRLYNTNVKTFVRDPLYREHHDFFIAVYLHTGNSALVGRRRPNMLARTFDGSKEFYIHLLVSHCRKDHTFFPVWRKDEVEREEHGVYPPGDLVELREVKDYKKMG